MQMAAKAAGRLTVMTCEPADGYDMRTADAHINRLLREGTKAAKSTVSKGAVSKQATQQAHAAGRWRLAYSTYHSMYGQYMFSRIHIFSGPSRTREGAGTRNNVEFKLS